MEESSEKKDVNRIVGAYWFWSDHHFCTRNVTVSGK